MDRDLFSERVHIEKKAFSFDLRENPRGRFLRIAEETGERRDAVVVPAAGLGEFRRLLDRVIEADAAAGPRADRTGERETPAP